MVAKLVNLKLLFRFSLIARTKLLLYIERYCVEHIWAIGRIAMKKFYFTSDDHGKMMRSIMAFIAWQDRVVL